MNAAAYLQNQGWRGLGYSLDSSNRGLAKPILVSKKGDQAGLGNKKHNFENEWWATAFDKSLQQLGSQFENTEAVDPTSALSKRSGLYSGFVKAETLASTITLKNKSSAMAPKVQESGALLNSPVFPVGNLKIETADKDKKMSKSKKRKHESQEDVAEARPKISKKSKDKVNQQMDHGANFIPLPSNEQVDADPPVLSDQKSQKGRKEKISATEARAQLRAERKEKRKQQARENAMANKAAMEAAGLIKTDAEPKLPAPDPTRDLRGPPHPESIMAKRQSGELIDLPGDSSDINQLRYLLINHIENGREHQLNKALRRTMPTVDPKNPGESIGEVPGKKVSYKTALYKTSKAKREAKREARHWVDVRANTHLYKPDGTFIPPKERGVTSEELKAKRQADKEAKQRAKAEKEAKKEFKAQIKAERREALEQIHKQEKMHHKDTKQPKKDSVKTQRRKSEKEEAAAAAEMGNSYNASIETKDAGKFETEKAMNEESAKQTETAENRTRLDHSQGEAENDNSNDDANGEVALPSLSHTNGNPAAQSFATEPTPLYIFDTVGSKPNVPSAQKENSRDPNAPKRVKDMTKEERKARLELMRKRRAERNAAKGVTRLSNKERRERRAQTKEAFLNKLTNEILQKKKAEGDSTAPEHNGSISLQTQSVDLDPQQTRKQARKEARRLIRGAKKGTIPEEELPADLVKRRRTQKQSKQKKARGRGSRNK